MGWLKRFRRNRKKRRKDVINFWKYAENIFKPAFIEKAKTKVSSSDIRLLINEGESFEDICYAIIILSDERNYER